MRQKFRRALVRAAERAEEARLEKGGKGKKGKKGKKLTAKEKKALKAKALPAAVHSLRAAFADHDDEGKGFVGRGPSQFRGTPDCTTKALRCTRLRPGFLTVAESNLQNFDRPARARSPGPSRAPRASPAS